MTMCIFVALTLISAEPQEEPVLRSTPKLTIEYAISLLEKGDTKRYITDCLNPEKLNRFLQTGATLEDAVAITERRGTGRHGRQAPNRVGIAEPSRLRCSWLIADQMWALRVVLRPILDRLNALWAVGAAVGRQSRWQTGTQGVLLLR